MLKTWPAAKPVEPRDSEERSRRGPGVVRAIGALKLLKGLLLLALALGGLKLLNLEWQASVQRFIEQMGVDPGSQYFREYAVKLAHLSPRLPLIVSGTICYGLLFCVEGAGLLWRKRWAEYLTIISTGSFLPLEIYEMMKRQTAVKGVVIALNLAIFVYLIVRWRRRRYNARRFAKAARC